jgi:hypothetical protein
MENLEATDDFVSDKETKKTASKKSSKGYDKKGSRNNSNDEGN